MGGSGDLLLLALSVPPWEALHELTADELRLTNLLTNDAVANVKPVQDRFVNVEATAAKSAPLKSTRTATAEPPTGGAATAPDSK
jgi:hypothetical protein